MPQRGLLIVIEGLDRSGKTTQCTLLTSRLQSLGYKVRYQKFPDRSTGTGRMINEYLTDKTIQSDDHAIHLIFSANRWEASQSILRDLNDGATIVIDRYSFSGAVYSAAKGREDLGLEWAWYPEIGLPKPDLAIFLDIEEAEAQKRGGYGEERYEKEEMQRRVRTLFERLWDRLQHGQGLNVKTINAGRAVDEVGDAMWTCFEEVEKEFQGEEIGRLVDL